MAHDRAPEPPRQRPGVAAGPVLLVGLFTLAMVLGALVLVGLFMGGAERARGVFRAPGTFPPPRLQSDPVGDLHRYRREQEAALHSYAWVDRERKLVRIPIERAMAMIAARGTAAYAPLDTPGPGR